MDWSGPESVFGGLQATCLGVLWRAGTGMTGRQVARVAGEAGSARGIQYALHRLVQQGVVDVEAVGASNVYTINRDHLLFPAVDAAFREVDVWSLFTRRVREVVDEVYGDTDAVTVAVFGSVARGEAGLGSDLDLLVVTPDDDTPDRVDAFVLSLHTKARRWTGQPVQVYATTPRRLQEAQDHDDPIVTSFKADAAVVTGPPLADLWRAA
ncbi:MAG: nucleotidyltransferase domain-containing protein [Micrococcales bacterium]|nr:nucleotidyltransferase domain-containing protein [Micrococcales bacterium]MCL2666610.1 nucleotidyltransferase domain-containing protein [Micrococcales bacterium]